MKAKKGISLIVLVITIIVIIILAGAVIFSLSDKNPADQASLATFLQTKSDLSHKAQLERANLYLAQNTGETLEADADTVVEIMTKDIATANTKYSAVGTFSVTETGEVTFVKKADAPNWAASVTPENYDWVTTTP